MKNKIFLYLFVFASLIALYLFVSSGTLSETKDAKIEKLQTEIVNLKDSVQQLNIKILDVQHFSLENNDKTLKDILQISFWKPMKAKVTIP